MEKITIGMDLIAGLLMALDLFCATRGESIGRWLVRRLPDWREALNPLKLKTIRLNVVVTFYLLALMIIWAVKKDPATYTTAQFWGTMGLYASGAFLGAIVTTLLALAFNKLGKRCHWENTENQINTYVWLASMPIGILSLIIASRLATSGVIISMVPAATFVLTIFILPVVMMGAPKVRDFLVSKSHERIYVLARIGLIIFISSKAIDILI